MHASVGAKCKSFFFDNTSVSRTENEPNYIEIVWA